MDTGGGTIMLFASGDSDIVFEQSYKDSSLILQDE